MTPGGATIAATMSVSRVKWIGRALPAVCMVSAACMLTFKAGMVFESCQTSVCKQVKQIKRALFEPEAVQGVQFNAYEQLVRHPGKIEVPQPVANRRTLTLFVFGQSNAANAGGERFNPESANILNFHDGHYYLGSDPLLGASGVAGSPWNRLAKKLIDGGDADRVVLMSSAIGWTSVLDWAPGGRLHGMLLARLTEARQNGIAISHFLWHQGEEDTELDPVIYRQALGQIIRTVHVLHPQAQFWVAQASRCGTSGGSERLLHAQAAAALESGARTGPNTDLIGSADRYDDCHLSGSGLEKHAEMWFTALHGHSE